MIWNQSTFVLDFHCRSSRFHAPSVGLGLGGPPKMERERGREDYVYAKVTHRTGRKTLPHPPLRYVHIHTHTDRPGREGRKEGEKTEKRSLTLSHRRSERGKCISPKFPRNYATISYISFQVIRKLKGLSSMKNMPVHIHKRKIFTNARPSESPGNFRFSLLDGCKITGPLAPAPADGTGLPFPLSLSLSRCRSPLPVVSGLVSCSSSPYCSVGGGGRT